MGILDGKVAIVTGAGRGVGRGIALAFAKEGASVVVAERDAATTATTVSEIESFGGVALGVNCDVSSRAEVDAAISMTVQTFGSVDILVNNAQGAGPNGVHIPLETMTDKDFDIIFDTGFMGAYYAMQACFPHMKEAGGKIINIGSGAGMTAPPLQAAYAATKEATRTLGGTAAREWGKYGINVNAICPFANSPALERVVARFPDEPEKFTSNVPLGRIGDCEADIGRAAVFLAGPDSDYITGHTLNVDGGAVVMR